MSIYAPDAASALQDTQAAGAAVTFSSASAGTYDPTQDAFSAATTTTVAGYAVQTKPDLDTYEALSLVHASSRTLWFTPSTFGQLPLVGYTVVWGGVTYTVRSVDSVAPDGTVIGAKVVVSL